MLYNEIFSLINIGTLELKNRFVIPAMETNLANYDGSISDKYIRYWETRAKGGWGLLITGITAIDPAGKAGPLQTGIWDDQFIEGFRKLTDTVHKHGAKMAVQLHHAGRQTRQIAIGTQPVAPSPIPCPVCRDIPQELSIEEIYTLVEQFGDAAARARAAGFDAAEVHGAHGYLIAQFMSGYANKRLDEFGGSFENMMRFPVEIIKNIRKKAGDDFPIIFRFSAEEKVSGGRTLQEAPMVARVLEEAGVDALHVSVGVYASSRYIQAPPSLPPGLLLPTAAEIKKAVSLPVIAVGRINHPLLAENAVKTGKADLLAWGRQSLADPELPNKVAAGKLEDVAPCIACTQGCIENVMKLEDISCLVNPFCGREEEDRLKAAPNPKKVVVAGGGPAGLTAAWVAAARGHQVVLFEGNEEVGGQLTTAALPPAKHEFLKAILYFKQMCRKHRVDLRVGVEGTAAEILQEKPDTVIVATGGEPLIPNIKGADGRRIFKAVDLLWSKEKASGKVLVIGGGMVGCETADFLAERGHQVTIVESLPNIAGAVEHAIRHFLLERLKNHNVKIITGAKVEQILEDGVVILKDGEAITLSGFRTVALAMGVKSLNILAEELADKVPELHVIGDAGKPGKATEAVTQAAFTALTV